MNLNGGTFLDFGSFFGANTNALALGNVVNIGQGVTFPTGYFFINGGYSPTATENVINVNGDINNTSALISAGSANDAAYDNVVNINSDTLNLDSVFGAFSNNLVSGNKVNINGGTITTRNIAGGYISYDSESGTANNNEVNITTGSINTGGMYGGSGVISANENKININGGNITVLSDITAGLASNSAGTAKNNELNITGGTISSALAAASGNVVENNKLTISGGTIITDKTKGVSSGWGNKSAKGNELTINGGIFPEDTIFTASAGSANGNADKNILNLYGVTIPKADTSYGGLTGGAGGVSASENVVNIINATYQGVVYGGNAPKVTNNVLNVTGDFQFNESVLTGGRGAVILDNVVNINKGTHTFSNIDGAFVDTFQSVSDNTYSATGNKVNINCDSMSVGSYIRGATSYDSTNVATTENNEVNINGGSVYANGEIAGATTMGTATGNKVNISTDGIVSAGRIIGAYGASSTENNEVNIDAGTINADINAGNSHADDGISESNSLNNVVNIKGNAVVNGKIYGGMAYGANFAKALNNTINISDNSVINGTLIRAGESGSTEDNGTGGESSGNTVNISGGTIYLTDDGIYGGGGTNSTNNTVNITGGNVTSRWIVAGNGNYASNNTVNISGGVINAEIQGGYATSTSSNNVVNITGGTISGNIYASSNYGISTATATDNVINIRNNPDLNNAILLGYSYGPSHSGNTLNIYTKGLTAQNIANFDVINFYLPENIINGNTILTLSSTYTDISGARVQVGVKGNANLKKGDIITLLQNNGTITDTDTTYGKLTEGISLTYDLTLKKDGDNKIIAKIGNDVEPVIEPVVEPVIEPVVEPVTEPVVEPVTEPVVEPVIEPVVEPIRLNKKTEILTILPTPIFDIPIIPEYETFEEFDLNNGDKDLSIVENPEHKGWEIFADAGGGTMRYKTSNSSYIDTRNQNINLGFARNIGNMANKMTIAPIIDYQNTNYDSYLNDGTHGKGNSKYIGGGFVLRNMNHNGFYYEGSFRAGKNKIDFASNNLDTTGNFGTITYDTSATILNGHIKVGKYLRLNKNNLLDIYGFYYHTHQGGSNADLSSGEHYDFSAANSGRFRIGYRLTTRTSRISQVYTGLAYQYEYNSGVTANYKGYSTSGENHKGSSGMLELGWIIKPLKNNPWAVDINATGWIGNQRGVKAMAKIQKAF